MELELVAGRIDQTAADAVVVNLFESVTSPGGATGAIDERMGGMISQVIEAGDFKGKLNEILVLYPQGTGTASLPARGEQERQGGDTFAQSLTDGLPARRVLVVGLGKQEDFKLDHVRQVAATAVKRARDLGVQHMATIVHGAGMGGLEARDAAQAVAEGSLLGLYRYREFQSTDDEDEQAERDVDRLTVVEFDESKLSTLREGLSRGENIATAVRWTRDLVNRPGNDLPPLALAEAATAMASEAGLRCTVLDRDAIEAEGMGALLGVARGSREPPAFIVVEHEPDGTAEQAPLVLVGKGVTFDTGGTSIKPSSGMEEMKMDMAGGAAVLGAMSAIARLSLPPRVIGLVPATENMPGGEAIRPGDILRALDGTTIEVINTDAEGRLILADAVAYAQRYNPASIVDLATLTGACLVALGGRVAGFMSNNADLAAEVRGAANAVAELAWELPVWDDVYKQELKSDVADIKNTGGRFGGAITGAMFIKRFAKDVPWLHLDIAGPAMGSEEQPYTPKGGTGYGVRTLVELARGRATS
ncbi:MAG: leucyl aminopeptidase [Dehalococcoidia bacterium]|nr:leucyl aminopeptidase [Dehalococcoidia bacterium]